MVRINLIDPKLLADQHLLAEHVEILMLVSSAKKYTSSKVPNEYKLGTGHINFFKNKLLYLTNRFLNIQIEMRRRGYNTTATIDIGDFPQEQLNDYVPTYTAYNIIKQRLIEKLSLKPDWYTYEGKSMTVDKWKRLLGDVYE